MCGSDGTVRAKCVVQSACIVIGTQETRPSLSIKYTGRDAKKVFEADLLKFSRIKYASIAVCTLYRHLITDQKPNISSVA
ncbi:hypothetical protein AAF712_014324 [Marasmius tenuissimus]|uniref:Uncharacterized protein n=1 Tax=Marasmius tenuissimus TaxID=585030 RepID=A0ABR2ZCK5_9AGAR